MRTTITIDDDLLELAKERARARRMTLGQMVESALRAALCQSSPPTEHRFELVTFHGDGPVEGVNLDRTSDLIAAEDVERYGRER